MSATDDRLEILIGRSLDGETSLAEQQWLNGEFRRSSQARELFEQMKRLYACSRQTVQSEVLERGKSPEDILQQVWQRHEGTAEPRPVMAGRHWRFAAGVAAGFLLGLLLHLVLVSGDRDRTRPLKRPVVAADVGSAETPNARDTQIIPVNYPRPSMRSLDWYSFTDREGRQWLVEGVREGVVQPAVYRGDL